MFFGKEHEVYLYAQNGFEVSVLLPAGVYYVRKTFVVGDSEGAVYRQDKTKDTFQAYW